MRRLWALLVKEFIQMRRNGIVLKLAAVMPVIPVLIFGYAMHTDIRHLPTVVFDQSLQQEGRDLIASFAASGYFDIKYAAKSFQEVNDAIDQGKAKAGIIIPPDLADNVKHNRTTELQVIVDATESQAAASATSAAQMIVQMKSQEILVKRVGVHKTQAPYDVRVRAWYNPDFVNAYYKVTDIMGVILTITMALFTSMAIVRERERGTMEQLVVTPLTPWQLVIGKSIPYILIGYAQATVSLLAGIMAFDLPMQGTIALYYGLATLYMFVCLVLGILISTIAKTQLQAIQLFICILVPSLLLSGFMFPRAAMPDLFRVLGNIVPLTFYLEIVRGILLKGVSISFLWSQVLALMVFIAAFLTISMFRMQKRMV